MCLESKECVRVCGRECGCDGGGLFACLSVCLFFFCFTLSLSIIFTIRRQRMKNGKGPKVWAKGKQLHPSSSPPSLSPFPLYHPPAPPTLPSLHPFSTFLCLLLSPFEVRSSLSTPIPCVPPVLLLLVITKHVKVNRREKYGRKVVLCFRAGES